MFGTVEGPQAWALLRGMARSVDVDLVGAVGAGWMSRCDLGQLVETCETCPRVAACTAWLATHVAAASPPDFCANRGGLLALRA